MAEAARAAGRDPASVALTAVSKTQPPEAIDDALAAGLRVFGENRVQEAQGRWAGRRPALPDLEMRLIGPLQSNKAKEAVALFDCIETVDREKIAAELAKETVKQGKAMRFYVQVNTGAEPQKAGIAPQETVAFVERCRAVHGLAVEGLMCIPPVDENPGPHFALLAKLATEAGLAKLSMGMSGDYALAVAFGATSVRVGSAIFGSR